MTNPKPASSVPAADGKNDKAGKDKPSTNQMFADQYGYALAFMKEDPELWSLFERAVKENWTDGKFEAEFRDSKFYQTHSGAYRLAVEKRAADPASWEADIAKQRASMVDIAAQMGADISDKTLGKLANDAVLYGWSPDQLQNKLAKYVEVRGETGHYGGEAGISEDALRKMALDYGQRMSSKTLQSWVVNMARGDATLNDFKADMQKQAEVRYGPYSEQIRKGMTVADIAQPYIQEMAQTLELNPENIDVFDKHIQSALMSKQADTNKAGEFNLYDFQRQLRLDDRWQRTKGAQDQASELARGIAKDWGLNY